MRGAQAGLDQRLETRLDALERRDREWRPWLAALREAFHALEDDAWSDPRVAAPSRAKAARPDGMPLLHGQQLTVDVELVRAFISRLAAAIGHESYQPSNNEAITLLSTAAQYQRPAADALDQLAQLAAWPLLVACGRRLVGAIPATWAQGYCPVCGAWPLLAEQRGLERARRLRCGRCAADWPFPGLTCVYCGEHHHTQLGALVSEGELDARKIETCRTCRGYVKSIATLVGLSPADVLLSDLETVELDLVARSRGWQRPSQPARPLDVRVRAQGL
ncbi:MAG TPA: formate dehydrogenase accessory protein FdhE [Gemmatimonadales bacterium]|nr:formate dehydrogenase accessory protein FdhE [Gemmatimonadales bacterium]